MKLQVPLKKRIYRTFKLYYPFICMCINNILYLCAHYFGHTIRSLEQAIGFSSKLTVNQNITTN